MSRLAGVVDTGHVRAGPLASSSRTAEPRRPVDQHALARSHPGVPRSARAACGSLDASAGQLLRLVRRRRLGRVRVVGVPLPDGCTGGEQAGGGGDPGRVGPAAAVAQPPQPRQRRRPGPSPAGPRSSSRPAGSARRPWAASSSSVADRAVVRPGAGSTSAASKAVQERPAHPGRRAQHRQRSRRPRPAGRRPLGSALAHAPAARGRPRRRAPGRAPESPGTATPARPPPPGRPRWPARSGPAPEPGRIRRPCSVGSSRPAPARAPRATEQAPPRGRRPPAGVAS